ncbi:efflux RND transporter periplasmic adaptor subunit [Alphaproteobacteria bacterium KMM 3653]|uniref:Efflux RND transporter periplasmic adaptor subunit n=1 Tax=Harenicola maris TaxID=2841044 RepID=A0AAP2CP96_9RHOB|nr:efflux RND transporter periplasmic adaptor subunit [Harenicola maris]
MLRTLLTAASLSLFAFATPGAAQDTPLVKLITVTTEGGTLTRQFFGQVVAKQTVDLAFQVGGQIVEFPVLEGNTLPEGSVIAKLDLEPFELALEQAQATQNQAERTLERLEKLQGSSVSQVSVDDAKTAQEIAAIDTRNAKRALEQAVLHAPFDGLVAQRFVANFTTISAGTPAVRLHDMSELRVDIEVPEILFRRVGEKTKVEIWANFPGNDTNYPLEPREFIAEASEVGQTFRLTLGMERPEGVIALPGSSVTVTANVPGLGPKMEIPGSAIINDSAGNPHVLRFDPVGEDEGTLTMVPIQIEPSASGTISVISGLEAGQEIVASGAALLADGMEVRRFTGFAN